jgi:hypothetical protein
MDFNSIDWNAMWQAESGRSPTHSRRKIAMGPRLVAERKSIELEPACQVNNSENPRAKLRP